MRTKTAHTSGVAGVVSEKFVNLYFYVKNAETRLYVGKARNLICLIVFLILSYCFLRYKDLTRIHPATTHIHTAINNIREDLTQIHPATTYIRKETGRSRKDSVYIQKDLTF